MEPSARHPFAMGLDILPNSPIADRAYQAGVRPSGAEAEPDWQPEPPLMHFPHCRLSITSCDSDGRPLSAAAAASAGKIEQVALPGPLVRTLLTRAESLLLQPELPQPQPTPRQQQKQRQRQQTRHDRPPPSSPPSPSPPSPSTSSPPPPAAAAIARIIQVEPHFDDNDSWVFSRCLLADFTGFCEDEAEALSAQGALCCWASVALRPMAPVVPAPGPPPRLGQEDHHHHHHHHDRTAAAAAAATATATDEDGAGAGHGNGDGSGSGTSSATIKWELEFVVHRVGVRDPRSGWCECFLK